MLKKQKEDLKTEIIKNRIDQAINFREIVNYIIGNLEHTNTRDYYRWLTKGLISKPSDEFYNKIAEDLQRKTSNQKNQSSNTGKASGGGSSMNPSTGTSNSTGHSKK